MPKTKKPRNLKVNSRWIFKNSSRKVVVKIYAVELLSEGKRKHWSVEYGLLSSKASHISQSVEGFLENYDREC